LQEQYKNKNRRFGRKKPSFDDPEDGIYPSVLAGLKQLYRVRIFDAWLFLYFAFGHDVVVLHQYFLQSFSYDYT